MLDGGDGGDVGLDLVESVGMLASVDSSSVPGIDCNPVLANTEVSVDVPRRVLVDVDTKVSSDVDTEIILDVAMEVPVVAMALEVDGVALSSGTEVSFNVMNSKVVEFTLLVGTRVSVVIIIFEVSVAMMTCEVDGSALLVGTYVSKDVMVFEVDVVDCSTHTQSGVFAYIEILSLDPHRRLAFP